jgi:hypothetical protein
MLYRASITIPPNTSELSPERKTLKLTRGTVVKMFVVFPPGCCGLAHVRILDKESQQWPTSPDEDFNGEDYIFEWPEDYEVNEDPFEFTVEGWNSDNLYAHTPVVMVDVSYGLSGFLKYLARFFSG